jgi:hypothetical protein
MFQIFESCYIPIDHKLRLSSQHRAADALSRLDIDSLKMQEDIEEVLTLLSGSENNSISNIKLIFPLHTLWIFKEQAKVKDTGLREKGLSQPHYSIQLWLQSEPFYAV